MLTTIESAFVLVLVNPLERVLVEVGNEKTFDYRSPLRDDVRVTQMGDHLLKVFETGGGCREGLSGYFMEAGFVRQSSIDKEIDHYDFTR